LDLLVPQEQGSDLALGYTSQEHSRVLRFVAGEYEQLAEYAKSEQHKASLRLKAKKLFETAAI
jgi:hypothetical protein